MKVLIAGGAGFLGRALAKSLLADNQKVWILSRNPHPAQVPAGAQIVLWDGKRCADWQRLVNEIDVIVNLAGKSLASWPWTPKTKRSFLDSRVQPGLALVEAIRKVDQRPSVFMQASGVNYYGLRGDLADETTPPADDFLAQLAVQWEDVTKPVEALGIRRVVMRQAVVLDKREGLFPLMTLPSQLFIGGQIGNGKQAMPWIHIKDWVKAGCFLMENDQARGVYNLIAPTPTSSVDFVRSLAKALHRPYWLTAPAFLLRVVLGEMSLIITEGRFSQPKRLIESGYRFQFERVEDAFADLFG